MNPITTTAPATRKYLLAMATIAVVAIGAAGASALLAHASSGPTVTTVTTTPGNAVVTSAIVGTNVIEGAVVASSSASTTPTGTVTFSSFQNLTCTGTPSAQVTSSLVRGMASSSQVTMTNAGLSYLAVYNGDASNTPSVSSCAVVASTSAPVVVPPVVTASSTISGTVFNDANHNKVQDNGESGLPGILVWLHLGKHKYNSPIVATTTTDSIGHYVFSNLANGTYFVEQQLVNGFKQKSADKKVKLTVNKSSATVNFADVAASSTKKHVDNDNEGNDDHRTASSTKMLNVNIHATLKGLNGLHFGQQKDN